VPSLIAVAASTLITSWWYSHKIDIAAVSPSGAEIWRETSALVKLGFAFMASELLMMSSAYIVRIIVRQAAGMEATGFYQAAWTLGGLYVGMILQSMGADFYPRLAAVVHDHAQCNRLVNEQARVSMLLAGPGVLATLTFAPLVIWLFYAPNFGSAVSLLRWISLGIALRVISWPMGFIIMAKGRQNLILLCEASWTLVHLGLAWILVGTIGIDGAGIAFFGSYVFHIGLTYGVVRALSGFRWSADNRHTVLQYLALMAVVFLGCRFLQSTYATVVGALASLLSAVYAARIVVGLTRNIRLPQGV
jgi:PST family polysaccharide transporter